MKYNLSFYDVIARYMLMMVVVIAGGVLHSILIMVFAMPLFISGLLGWSPIYQILHIDHAVKSDSNEG